MTARKSVSVATTHALGRELCIHRLDTGARVVSLGLLASLVGTSQRGAEQAAAHLPAWLRGQIIEFARVDGQLAQGVRIEWLDSFAGLVAERVPVALQPLHALARTHSNSGAHQ